MLKQLHLRLNIDISVLIKLRKETGNVSKRHRPDQIAETAEGHQRLQRGPLLSYELDCFFSPFEWFYTV